MSPIFRPARFLGCFLTALALVVLTTELPQGAVLAQNVVTPGAQATTMGNRNNDILQAPFLCTPAADNLLLDLRQFSHIATTVFDYRVYSSTTSHVNTNCGNTDGNTDTEELVTRFTFASVMLDGPGPASRALLFPLFGLVGRITRRRK